MRVFNVTLQMDSGGIRASGMQSNGNDFTIEVQLTGCSTTAEAKLRFERLIEAYELLACDIPDYEERENE